jgi:hypothetical protein
MVPEYQRKKAYELANTHVIGRRLIPLEGRRLIAQKTIEAFEEQMKVDPFVFDQGDRLSIIRSIKSDPEVKTFAIIPVIIMAIIGWIVQKILDYLWDSRN